MRSPEERVRRWLRLYPRSYREHRGEELIGTLLDISGGSSHLRGNEVMSVVWHAARGRLRHSRPLSAAVVLALVAAGATYTYQEVHSSPASYSASLTFIHVSAESGLSPFWFEALRLEVLAPPVIASAEALWHSKQPVCSVVQRPSTNLLVVTCTSPRRIRSSVPLQLLSAFQTIESQHPQSAGAREVRSLGMLIAETSRELKSVSRTSHRFRVIQRNLDTAQVELRTVLSQPGIPRAYRVIQLGRPVEHRAVNVSGVDVTLAGIAGALLVLATVSRRNLRRRPLQPA
jgi:hypothetical protein